MKINLRISAAFMTFAISSLSFLAGCKKDDPEPVNESELITTLRLTFTKLDLSGNAIGEDPFSFTWKDADGAGPLPPVIEDVVLDANSYYSLSLTLLDESKNPAEDITEEIEEEGDDHQFFFVITADAQVEYNDSDNNGKPVGLENFLTTGNSGQGNLRVILRHEPDKNASGVAGGDPAQAGGETDLEATFPLKIE